jgi:LuxR family quorum sensing-dependent transcriptional regulator
MVTGAAVIALSEGFRDMTSGAQVLDALENAFAGFGGTHFLATGLPLPGRPVEPLILRMRWGDLRHDRGSGSVSSGDALIQLALNARRPFAWYDSPGQFVHGDSALLAEVGPEAHLIVVSVCAYLPYQGVVIAAGKDLAFDQKARLAIDHLCAEAFGKLFQLQYLRPERPGELSARERRVVELSAGGKTASEIAAILLISQRTVHAHLQNASEKLRATNKTHTVVEALRYGQISV